MRRLLLLIVKFSCLGDDRDRTFTYRPGGVDPEKAERSS
jgi:hypothetical protein